MSSFNYRHFFFRCDRVNKTGGGVCLWSRNTLKAKYVTSNSTALCEYLWVSLNEAQVLFGVYYVPPHVSNITYNCNIISNEIIDICKTFLISFPEFKIVTAGDLNNFDTRNIINNLEISPLKTENTRGTSVLDFILVSNDIFPLYECTVGPSLQAYKSESDHGILIAHQINTTTSHAPVVRYAKCLDLRVDSVRSAFLYLHSLNLRNFYLSEDCNEMCNKLHEYILTAISNIPCKTYYFTINDAPWMTVVIKELIHKRSEAFQSKNFAQYHHYKEKVKKAILQAKQNWSEKICSSAKGVWNLVNWHRQKSNKCNIWDSFDECTESLLNKITDHFCNSFNTTENNFYNFDENHKNLDVIVEPYIVYSYLCKLKNGKAPGHDGFLNRIVKLFAPFICEPVSAIVNCCLRNCTYPDLWKTAIFSPVPKCKSHPTLTLDLFLYYPLFLRFLNALCLTLIKITLLTTSGKPSMLTGLMLLLSLP